MIEINTAKRFKYIWFVLFYITFIFIAIIYSCQVVENLTSGKTWQDVASYDFKLVDQTFDDGVLTNTYGISTPEQLAGVFMINESTEKNLNNSSLVYADTMDNIGESDEVITINSEYILLNDVNMSGRSWTPSDFKYIFNGNYHVISNLEISSSAYNYLGMVQRLNGTIKNLFLKNITVKNSNITGTSQGGAGSVAGECYGDIINVTVLSGTITGPITPNSSTDREVKTGGIAGALTNYGKIINCTNYATVRGGKYIGGIVGYFYNGTIEYCRNHGAINTYNRYMWPRAGGICGKAQSKISLCENLGNVNSTSTPYVANDARDIIRVGGIVGETNSTVDQCANHGIIKGGNTSGVKECNVGGIVGCVENAASSVVISNCFNRGDVNAFAKKQENNFTYIEDSIPECDVHEDIQLPYTMRIKYSRTAKSGEIVNEESIAYAGGIVAYFLGKIQDSYNTGNVSGGSYYLKFETSEQVKLNYSAWGSNEEDGREENLIFNIYQFVYYQPICPTNATISNVFYSNAQDIYTGYINQKNDFSIVSISWGISGSVYNWYEVYGDRSDSVKNMVGKDISTEFIFMRAMEFPGGDKHTIECDTVVTQSGTTFTLTYKSKTINCWNKADAQDVMASTYGLKYGWSYTSTEYNNLAFSMVGTASSSISEQDCFTDTDSMWAVSSNINDGYPYLKNLYW